MGQTSLLNPFNLNSVSAQKDASHHAGRATPVCSACQSDDIIRHATVQWSNESQQWELANTFDQPAHCNCCDQPCGISWLPLN